MTGLDTSKDTIMSLAAFVTDADLNILDEDGYEAIIHHDKEQLDQMGEWCTRHHGDSGLTQACLDSTTTAEAAARACCNTSSDSRLSVALHLLLATRSMLIEAFLYYSRTSLSSIIFTTESLT